MTTKSLGRSWSKSVATTVLATLGVLAPAAVMMPSRAQACGCFAPPDVSNPVVQAGERILFAKENGQIVMHVQIQYKGNPADFGWLLPLPGSPVTSDGKSGIELGVEELFTKLEEKTGPTYTLQRIPCSTGFSGIGCGAQASADFAPFNSAPGQMSGTPLVKQDSVGPYDYAILKADDKTAMFNWLTTNKYFVPAGTDGAVAPYIHPGGYFLALRLRAGATAGDLQPVVLRYPGDLPMVPINLTAVGAVPNMGILIWVLGPARAIPRNYYHTVINDAQIDWLNKAKNYQDVLTRAVREAPGKHAFVTEFAEDSSVMRNVLDSPGRYDFLQSLPFITDPMTFVSKLLPPPADPNNGPFGNPQPADPLFALNGQFTAVIGKHVPMPAALIATGVTPSEYYQNIGKYLTNNYAQNAAKYPDIAMALLNFNSTAAAKDLDVLIAKPTLAAGKLFSLTENSKLTRMFTVLSPEDMNLDPVFSYNASLPNIGNQHNATLVQVCKRTDVDRATLTTGDGWKLYMTEEEDKNNAYKPLDLPYARVIEQLQDTGAAVIKVDNTAAIRGAVDAAGATGCSTPFDGRQRPSASPMLVMLGLSVTALLARRRLFGQKSLVK